MSVEFSDPQVHRVLAAVLQRLASEPASAAARQMARALHALFLAVEFDLSELDTLPKNDQELVGSVFAVLMDSGISEDERQAAALALQPYANYQVH